MTEERNVERYDDGADGIVDDERVGDGIVGDGIVVDEAELTGDYRVDVALSRLAELVGVPVAEHVAVYEDVHAQLQAALVELDER
jgi:hypothetical protein